MRIAFVKQKYMPMGGGEGFLGSLMACAVARGHEVHLLTTAWPAGKAARVTVHALSYRRFTRAGRMTSFSSAVGRFMQAHDFDVRFSLDRTACQDVWHAGEGVHGIWLQRRRCFESRWRAWWNAHAAGQRALVALEKRCFQNSAVIIAPSQVVSRDLREMYGATDKEIHVIPCGVDLERFTVAERRADRLAVRNELGLTSKTPLFLFAGHGFRRKGLTETLDAFSRLGTGMLVVIGRDKQAPWRAQAARLGIGQRVVFLSARGDLARFFHAADVLVFPSWFDSFGLVGGEALACGTPLITTPFAGVSELVRDGFNGRLVSSPAAIDELAAALQEIAAWPLSESRAVEIADSIRWCSREAQLERLFAVVEGLHPHGLKPYRK